MLVLVPHVSVLRSPFVQELSHPGIEQMPMCNRPVSTGQYRLELELIGHVESFNGRLRDECLNVDQLVTLDDAREKFEAWRHHYNRNRPHSLLRNLTPYEFARQGQVVRNDAGGDFSLLNCLNSAPSSVRPAGTGGGTPKHPAACPNRHQIHLFAHIAAGTQQIP